MERDTVSMYFVRAAVARLTPLAGSRALATAGIAPDLANLPLARVPSHSFAALWLAVARELDDEFFGLDSRRMKVGSFALLCQAVLSSENLDRALKRLLRGFGMFLDDVSSDLRLENHQAVITITNRIESADSRRFADETFLVMTHGLMCWLTGRRIPLLSAGFAFPRPNHASEYAIMFSDHLHFDAAFTTIRFESSHLSAPVVQTAHSLKQFLRSAPQSVFLKYKNEDSWSAKVRRRLRDSLAGGDWPLLEGVADELRVAPTTLRRRLTTEGTSYKDIKDQLRRDAAVHHLCHSTMSVADIAAVLGFQDPSAFHRAFKKWCGAQPGEYRTQQNRSEIR